MFQEIGPMLRYQTQLSRSKQIVRGREKASVVALNINRYIVVYHYTGFNYPAQLKPW
jgi:hypothetical protein